MKTKTQKQPPAKMEKIFNSLMEVIEPELCTYNLDAVRSLYRDETPEQKDARAERYARAIERFTELFDYLCELLQEDLENLKDAVVALKQTQSDLQTADDLSAIEDSIDQD